MQHAQQPTYHFPTQHQPQPQPQQQQQQQFVRTHHFSHVTSASGSHTEPKKIARVQPQMQSQPRSTSSGMPRATASATSSSSRPMASTSGGSAMQQQGKDTKKIRLNHMLIHGGELHITYSFTLSTPHCSYTYWGQRPYCLLYLLHLGSSEMDCLCANLLILTTVI